MLTRPVKTDFKIAARTGLRYHCYYCSHSIDFRDDAPRFDAGLTDDSISFG